MVATTDLSTSQANNDLAEDVYAILARALAAGSPDGFTAEQFEIAVKWADQAMTDAALLELLQAGQLALLVDANGALRFKT